MLCDTNVAPASQVVTAAMLVYLTIRVEGASSSGKRTNNN